MFSEDGFGKEECFQQTQNQSLIDGFCTPACDFYLCWNATEIGKTICQPCPAVDGMHTPDDIETGIYAFRTCQESGEWLENITNFNICLNYYENYQVISPDDSPAFSIFAYVTIIGSSISLVTLAATLLIFFHFKALHCSRLKVHGNLSVALVINHILLITNVALLFHEKSSAKIGWLCKSALVLYFYSAMASINWMFVEGLLLHCRVTVHIFKQDAPFKLYYCIGWGLPAVLTSCWAFAMTRTLDSTCWEGYGKNSYTWIIKGPMLTALGINTIFLINIIRILISKRHAQVTVETIQVKKAIKATCLLFPLLGLTHLIFCVNPGDDGPMQDAYMITNTLIKSSQGFFVGVLYCFMNNDVQNALRNAYQRSVIRRNPNYRGTRGRGMSQTSTSYISHSDGFCGDTYKQKNSVRATLKLQDCNGAPQKYYLNIVDTKKGGNSTLESIL